MTHNDTDSFTLDQVHVHPSRNELEAHGQTLRLQPKVMEVLHYLARHSERVVPKEELVEQVWAGRVVTHGSVQKSINLLRKALTELLGEREIITHYSKRGYQLQVQPVFALSALRDDSGPAIIRRRWWPALLGMATLVGLYLFTLSSGIRLEKHHRTDFAGAQPLIAETGHETAPEPHPDGEHLAYIWVLSVADDKARDSQILVRDTKGKDWRLASTDGQWLELGWSPSGDSLLALERISDEGQPSTPSFFGREPQLYDLHIFRLDLERRRVLEKHRLSQWQGHLGSATWWDETTVELVGRQGDTALNQRYHYSLSAQRLELAPAADFLGNPLISRVHGNKVAVASQHNGRIRIDLLGPDGGREASHLLDDGEVEISWIPDGSGVLLYSPGEQTLTLLYRDGETRPVKRNNKNDVQLTHHRYRADGQTIIYAQSQPQTVLWQLKPDGTRRMLSEPEAREASQGTGDLEPLSLNKEGGQLVALRATGGARNLWRIHLESGDEQQLTFGAIASAIPYRGDIYFNYVGQRSLWVLRDGENPQSLSRALEQNAKLLGVTENSVFYVTGGPCRESDVFRLDFVRDQKSVYLARDQQEVSTESVHPEQGVLYSQCELTESDIWVLSGSDG